MHAELLVALGEDRQEDVRALTAGRAAAAEALARVHPAVRLAQGLGGRGRFGGQQHRPVRGGHFETLTALGERIAGDTRYGVRVAAGRETEHAELVSAHAVCGSPGE